MGVLRLASMATLHLRALHKTKNCFFWKDFSKKTHIIQLGIHGGPAKCDLVPKDEQNKILLLSKLRFENSIENKKRLAFLVFSSSAFLRRTQKCVQSFSWFRQLLNNHTSHEKNCAHFRGLLRKAARPFFDWF